MDHVGLVLGLEMSRLSRTSRDWHHLLEVCALFGTLLADQDGVYDANDTNDRLLLGLKGTISEFELVTMRNRLDRGRLHKAERGELFSKVPCGYVKLPSGEVAFDPDEQARDVVRLIFDKFNELGSIYGVFHYLIRNGIRLGMRLQSGPLRGQLTWRRPVLPTLNQMLHNPTYAGAYAYGRRRDEPKAKAAGRHGRGQRWLPISEWKVLLKDRLPAYIGWDQYLANLRRLEQNRSVASSPGTPRGGVALLTGLVVCGTCGHRMHATYPSKSAAYYSCEQHLKVGTGPTCHGLRTTPVDDLVARQVLRALEPAALELSLQAAQDVRQERDRLHRHWEQQLERAALRIGACRAAVPRGRTGEPPGRPDVGASLGGGPEQSTPARRRIRPIPAGPTGRAQRGRARPDRRVVPRHPGPVERPGDDVRRAEGDHPPADRARGRPCPQRQ